MTTSAATSEPDSTPSTKNDRPYAKNDPTDRKNDRPDRKNDRPDTKNDRSGRLRSSRKSKRQHPFRQLPRKRTMRTGTHSKVLTGATTPAPASQKRNRAKSAVADGLLIG